NAEALLRDTHQAARTLGLELRVLQATNESDISKAFASAAEQHMRALLIGSDPSFGNQRKHIGALAGRDLRQFRVREDWWSDELRGQRERRRTSCGRLCCPHSKGREGC